MSVAMARRLGCTEGQLYTMATGLVLALLLAFAGAHPASGDASANAFPAAVVPPPLTAPPAAPPVVVPPGSGVAPAPPIVAPEPFPVGGGSGAGGQFPATTGQPPSPAPFDPEPPPTIPSGPFVLARIGAPGAPAGLAVRPDGHVLVSTDNGTAQGMRGRSKILELDPTGRQLRDVTVSGQTTDHQHGLRAAAVSPSDGSVHVADVDSGNVFRVQMASQAQSLATRVPDMQPCPLVLNAAPCEPGLENHKPVLSALAFDAGGDLFIADAGQGTIWRWTPGKPSPVAWYQSTDLATGDGPAGLSFGATGGLYFTAGRTLDSSNVNAGALYRLDTAADGSAGARTRVAGFASDERPGAIVADPFGAVYVILRGKGTIVVADGGAVRPFPTTGTPIALDGPGGLAFSSGRLLVANGSISTKAASWAVLSFPGLPS